MSTPSPQPPQAAALFDEKRAASYEDRFQKLSPFRDAMHLCMTMAWVHASQNDSGGASLPEDAHILCVGAGTGLEMECLAKAFPKWRFTAVDPAGSMLAIGRAKAKSLGYSDRCTFYEGYLDAYLMMEAEEQKGSPTPTFDAATCLLVSHFLFDETKRIQLFEQIASCLKPGGQLIVADLAMESTMTTTTTSGETTTTAVNNEKDQRLFRIWMTAIQHALDNPEAFQEYEAKFDDIVSLLSPTKVASLIQAGGFDPPIRLCQTLLIHTWLAIKTTTTPTAQSI